MRKPRPQKTEETESYNFDIRLKHFKTGCSVRCTKKKKNVSACGCCRFGENDICKEKSRVEANVTGEINEV